VPAGQGVVAEPPPPTLTCGGGHGVAAWISPESSPAAIPADAASSLLRFIAAPNVSHDSTANGGEPSLSGKAYAIRLPLTDRTLREASGTRCSKERRRRPPS